MTGGELLIVFLGLVAVAIVGFVVGRATSSGAGESHKLKEKLEEARAEHEAYKQEVTHHFEKTAELFKDMTGAYRSLYNHMAESSSKLGVGPSGPLLEADPARQGEEALDYGTADAETDETAAGTDESTPAPEQPVDYPQARQMSASKTTAPKASGPSKSGRKQAEKHPANTEKKQAEESPAKSQQKQGEKRQGKA
ncbi:YhcB family protein [Alkalilimnicola ehrlichii]|uniref:YhcB family protein n=1 Tax=Alkalilimnicola ehrlichii TaxID=351052 RepID=UPI003BA2E2A5